MTGNNVLDKIILILALLATVAAAGVHVYTNMIFSRPSPIEEIERRKFEKELATHEIIQGLAIEDMIINLRGETKRLRFLNLTVNIVPFEKNDVELFGDNTNRPYIQDMIIRLAGDMSPEDLNSISGKLIFEDKIKTAIDDYFKRPAVKEIFFTKFVVQ
ncbi:MAG: flagellar basal body-associated FliL family protein [Halobacteriovoraceae bacterium]|nr:flagellar basal body-associated FliL family protein [Halobacteriovoraceae bacterium]